MMVYNQAYCLHKCMRSIQNQSLKNIEIIVVDDCSLDNSVELIKEYQKEDPRIILIEHDANMGMIKTRSDGMRMAKGLYVTTVDGDDAFIHKDILKNSLYIAQKGNIDVVEFPKRFFSGQNFYETIYHFPNLNLNYIVHQPELRTKFTFNKKQKNFIYTNKQIIGKLIKNELYKKALEYAGKEYTEDYINHNEDTIIVISILHLANSYYLMKEVGYVYFIGQKRKYFKKNENKVCKVIDKLKNFSKFKYIKFLVEKTGNNFKEQNFAYRQITELKFDNFFNNTNFNERHYNIVLKIFEQSLTFKYLNKKQKDYLILIRNKIIERKKSI